MTEAHEIRQKYSHSIPTSRDVDRLPLQQLCDGGVILEIWPIMSKRYTAFVPDDPEIIEPYRSTVSKSLEVVETCGLTMLLKVHSTDLIVYVSFLCTIFQQFGNVLPFKENIIEKDHPSMRPLLIIRQPDRIIIAGNGL